MALFVTTHNSSGQAVFSNKVSPQHTGLPNAMGGMKILSTTHSVPIDVSNESDLDQYIEDRTNGFGTRLCPEKGIAVAILDFQPNATSPNHRTMTLDVCIVMEGVLELLLDSGERQTLQAGDSVVQRAGMHRWINKTPNNSWAKMVGISQPILEPLKINGKQLETEFTFS